MAEIERQEKGPELERKREWAHGDQGNKDCSRKAKPIFTDPQRVPDECRGWTCNNNEWRSKGHVIRNKATGKVLARESGHTDGPLPKEEPKPTSSLFKEVMVKFKLPSMTAEQMAQFKVDFNRMMDLAFKLPKIRRAYWS